MVQYLESICENFEIDSMANREPVQVGQNWRDVEVPRHLCNSSSKGVEEFAPIYSRVSSVYWWKDTIPLLL